jgi:hypothetical protein
MKLVDTVIYSEHFITSKHGGHGFLAVIRKTIKEKSNPRGDERTEEKYEKDYVHKYIIVYSMIIFIKVYFHSKITKLFAT